MPRNKCLPKDSQYNGRVRCWDCGERLLVNDDLNPEKVVGEHRATKCSRPQSGGPIAVAPLGTESETGTYKGNFVKRDGSKSRTYSKWKDIEHKSKR